MEEEIIYPVLSEVQRIVEIRRVAQAILQDVRGTTEVLLCPSPSEIQDVSVTNLPGVSESLLERWGKSQAEDIHRAAQSVVSAHRLAKARTERNEMDRRARELKDFETCTTRRKTVDGEFRISCRRGQWLFESFDPEYTVREARKLFQKYRAKGVYDELISGARAEPAPGRQKVILSIEEAELLVCALEYHPDMDAQQMRRRVMSEMVSTPWMDKMRALAVADHDVEGELEIDDAAPVAYADGEGGAYVMAFVWVAEEEPGDEQEEKGAENQEDIQEDILRQHHRVDSGEIDPEISPPDGHPDSDGGTGSGD